MTRADSSPQPEPSGPDPARPESPQPESPQPRPYDELVEPLFAGLSGAGGSESSAARQREDGSSTGDEIMPTPGSPAEGVGAGAGPLEGEDPASWEVVDPTQLARESTTARLLGMLLGALLVALLLRLMAGLPLIP